MIVLITQSPNACGAKTQAGTVLRRWLKDVGIDAASCSWLSVLDHDLERGEAIKPRDIKAGALRLRDVLGGYGSTIEVVIAVGSDATKIDGDLWRQDMSKRHGHSGKLWGAHPAIAMYHPQHYIRQTETRRRVEIENSCRLVLSRALHVNDVVVLPEITIVPGYAHVSGLVGLDCETTRIDDVLAAIKAKKPTLRDVDPRASRLKMVGLSDGQLSESGAVFEADAEPIAYNMPFDALVCAQESRDSGRDPYAALGARWHDPKMLAHLLGEQDTEMKSLAMRWLGRPLMHYSEAGGTGDEPGYCVGDSQAHRDLLAEGMRRAPAGVKWLYENIERPMLRLYARWAYDGVFELDRERAEAIAAIQTRELEEYRLEIWQKTGITNPSATQQVARYVHDWRPPAKQPSVEESILAKMRDDPRTPRQKASAIGDILAWRERNKAKGTYVDAWLRWPFELLGTLWRGTGAWTGRPSSAALNLQNVSAGCDHHDADDLFRCKRCASFNLRALLRPRAGKHLISADNSQLEVRIAAHISKDANLLALLRGEMPGYEDADLHRWAADVISRAVGHALSRTYGKIFNFSTLYGGSEMAIISQAARFNVKPSEIAPAAKIAHRELPLMFPGFFAWKHTVEHLDRVPGLFGAILVPPPHPDESYLERERVNAPIQRGGIDVLKIQTLDLESKGWRVVHQIHDEAIIEVDAEDDTPALRAEIARIMSEAVELAVPLVVNTKLWAA